MELVLVGADQVRENSVQPEESTIPEELAITEEEKEEIAINEFQVSEDLKEVLDDIHDLAIGGIDVHGFKSYAFMHPNRDYEVIYCIKGGNVIMIDYHGTNTLKIDVLGKDEADLFINNVKEAFGDEEINTNN